MNTLYKDRGSTLEYVCIFDKIVDYVDLFVCVLIPSKKLTSKQFFHEIDVDFCKDPHNPKSGDECFDSDCLVYYYKNNEDGYLYFDDEGCGDECLGWDGISTRCHCGNRRVEYVNNGSFSVYIKAY